MRLIKPSWEILTVDGEPIDGDKVLRFIEKVARTCYKSEDRIGPGTHLDLVRKLIARQHWPMLEFYDIVVKFVIDRGVSHELVRHRIASYAQESTRFCNYKGGVAFIIPNWLSNLDSFASMTNITPEDICAWYDTHESCEEEVDWLCDMLDAENAYLRKVNDYKWPAQRARSVLPNSLKTEIVSKFNLREWRQVFTMRVAPTAHEQMREVMQPLLDEFKRTIPLVFDDITYALEKDE